VARTASEFGLKLLFHTIAAALLPLAICMLVGLPAAALFNESKLIDYLSIGPSFSLPILAGAVSGYLFTRRSNHTSAAYWVWCAPAMLLLWSVHGWRLQAIDSSWKDIWDNFVGTHCATSECLYELVTATFLSSIAYAIAAVLVSRSRHASRASVPEESGSI
jgi:hypothetical protein